jgi:anaerobic selenocysteine-containing dehydrogenase
MPEGVAEQIAAMRSEPLDAAGRVASDWPATHLLVCRRTRQYFNSTGHDLERLRVKGVTNYAYMHPSELTKLGLVEEDVVEISTADASILGIAKVSDDLKPGVISMAHAFGARGEDAQSVRAHGSSTNRLVNDEREYDPITGQCRQSAILVRVSKSAMQYETRFKPS